MQNESFSYEKSISEIKKIAETLKNQPNNFEENLELFTKAMSLIKQCQEYIANSELSVKKFIDGEIIDIKNEFNL